MENYLDKWWFRLVLVVLASLYIVELGSIDSYAKRIGTEDFYKEYLATLIISYAIFELVYHINRCLDKKKPWHGQVIHRLLLQIIFGWITPLFIVFGLATIYFMLYGVNIMRTDYLYYAFPFVVFMVLLLNILFVMTPYFLVGMLHFKYRQSESLVYVVPEGETTTVQIKQSGPRVKVQDGIDALMLEPWEISAAYIIDRKQIVRGQNGKEYLTELYMDDLEKNYLPAKDFFRINRQLIVSRNSIAQYKPIEHYKMQVTLSFQVPVDPIISQLKVKSFKEWIAAED